MHELLLQVICNRSVAIPPHKAASKAMCVSHIVHLGEPSYQWTVATPIASPDFAYFETHAGMGITAAGYKSQGQKDIVNLQHEKAPRAL